jgi:hypothetical protein
MTLMDITLHYLAPVGPRQLRAMDSVREVYGIRRLSLDEIRHSILVGMTRLACTPKMCGRCFEVQAWIRTMSLKQFLMLVEVCVLISKESTRSNCPRRSGLRAVRADRIAMGAPANLPGEWRHTLL